MANDYLLILDYAAHPHLSLIACPRLFVRLYLSVYSSLSAPRPCCTIAIYAPSQVNYDALALSVSYITNLCAFPTIVYCSFFEI